jgi:hypothetical protein
LWYPTPIVTGLSPSSGTAGTTITIIGQNFSGAAGRLEVLFGSTPATNVQVVDDAYVTATVPAGSGTVDVRVQSGNNTGADPENIRSPIFGYGTAAVVAADKFTYTSSAPATSPDTAALGPIVIAPIVAEADLLATIGPSSRRRRAGPTA